MLFIVSCLLVHLLQLFLPGLSVCWPPEDSDANCSGIGCVPHIAPLDIVPYPLTSEMFQRSVPYQGNVARLHEIMRQGKAGKPLRVIVLGGSVTLGAHCRQDGNRDLSCSWVPRIETWLRARFPASTVHMDVRAVAGCSSVCQLAHIQETLPRDNEDIDLVLIDLSVNDASFGIITKSIRMHFAPLERFHNDDVIRGAIEVMLRRALTLQGQPAVVYMHAFQARNITAGWRPQDLTTPVVQSYGAHTVSYRDAVWPLFENRDADVDNIFWAEGDRRGIHPGWRSHQLYADTLAHFLDHEYVQACKEAGSPISGETFASPTGEPRMPTTPFLEQMLCYGNNATTYYNAEDPDTYGSVTIQSYLQMQGQGAGVAPPMCENRAPGGWALFSDRKDNPGYIGFGITARHATAEFTLRCKVPPSPKTALLAITYLESYSGVGAVRVFGSFPDRAPGGLANFMSNAVVLDALDTSSKLSTYVTQYVQMDESFYAAGSSASEIEVKDIRVFFMLLGPGDDHAVRSGTADVRSAWKFKIVRVSCC